MEERDKEDGQEKGGEGRKIREHFIFLGVRKMKDGREG